MDCVALVFVNDLHLKACFFSFSVYLKNSFTDGKKIHEFHHNRKNDQCVDR